MHIYSQSIHTTATMANPKIEKIIEKGAFTIQLSKRTQMLVLTVRLS